MADAKRDKEASEEVEKLSATEDSVSGDAQLPAAKDVNAGAKPSMEAEAERKSPAGNESETTADDQSETTAGDQSETTAGGQGDVTDKSGEEEAAESAADDPNKRADDQEGAGGAPDDVMRTSDVDTAGDTSATDGMDDETADAGSEDEDEEEKLPKYPLPEDLKFGYAPAEATFDKHKKMMNVIIGDFTGYKYDLAQLRDMTSFTSKVLLLEQEDCVCAGSPKIKEIQTELLRKNRAFLTEHVVYDDIKSRLIEQGVLKRESDDMASKMTENARKMEFLLDLLPSQGPEAVPKFLAVLREIKKEYVVEWVYAGETKPAEMVVDYASKKLIFKPREPEDIVVPSVSKSTEGTSANQESKEEVAMETDQSPGNAEQAAGKTEKTAEPSPGDAAETKPPAKPKPKVLGKTIEIPCVRIRYVSLNQLGTTIMVSFWTAEDREPFENVFLHTDPHALRATFKLLNALRRLIYVEDGEDKGRIDAFKPYCAAYAQVKLFKGDNIGDPPVPDEQDYDTKFVIYDEEGIAVCEEENHEKPSDWFKMHVEMTANSIERIYYHGISGHVMQVDKHGCRAYINLTKAETDSQKVAYDRIKYELRTNITPKPKDTWNFSDKEVIRKWAEFVDGYIKYTPDDNLYRVPSTDPAPPLASPPVEQSDEAMETVVNERQGETVPLPGVSGFTARGAEAEPPTQQTQERFDLESLITQLQTSSMARASEDEQVAWLTKWSLIEENVKQNTIPESSLASTGIEENDGTHFTKTVMAIKEDINEDRMLAAFSNMRGLEKVFSKSMIFEITGWLRNFPEEERLQQVFLFKPS